MTYDDLTTDVANLLVLDSPGNAEFLLFLPTAISNAQTRICRELDFLGAVTTSVVGPLTANNRNIDWTNSFFAIENINIISPAGQTNPELGTRNPVLFVTKDFCDVAYPSSSGAGVPAYLGRVTQSAGVLAPWPDGAYYAEVTGTQRPAVLSASNKTNFISLYLYDLLLAAVMIEMTAWQLNFNPQPDNQAMSTNWSAHYGELLKSAIIEEARKRFASEGWSSAQPSPTATPPRT